MTAPAPPREPTGAELKAFSEAQAKRRSDRQRLYADIAEQDMERSARRRMALGRNWMLYFADQPAPKEVQGERNELLFDPPPPEILLQAIVTLGQKTLDGHVIDLVTPAWFKIIDLMLADSRVMFDLDPRKWEEMVAAAYSELGYDVILTPRSGDGGRDVIATRDDIGRIRFFEQVKAYAPDRPVPADDVRALLGVLSAEGNVSKGIITTTSTFAPGIEKDVNLQRLMPYHLELRSGEQLLEWLRDAKSQQTLRKL